MPVLDAGGAPIRLDPNAGPPTHRPRRHDHARTAARSARSASSRSTSGAKLTRVENSGVVPDRPATPVLDFAKVGVHQGYIERSNVNPVLEMTKLIMVQHAFEAVTASLKDSDTSLQEAIRTLGATS